MKTTDCTVLLVLFIGLFLVTTVQTAHAVPTLQLYSDGAVYDEGTESWMTYSDPFVLQVLGADQPNNLIKVDQMMLHIAVPEQYFSQNGSVTIAGISGSLEQGTFATRTYTATDFAIGIPSQLAGNSGHSRSHGIYPTHYITVPLENLQVDKQQTDTIINYVDVIDGKTPGTDTGDIDRYLITYNDFFLIHMDLTGMTNYPNSRKNSMEFAPFSHDADAPPGNVVPEPGTVLLVGAGLVGLRLYGRRKSRSA